MLTTIADYISLSVQAIAAMMRAQEADPTNLEVLLALGVSHTNGKRCFLAFSSLKFLL